MIKIFFFITIAPVIEIEPCCFEIGWVVFYDFNCNVLLLSFL